MKTEGKVALVTGASEGIGHSIVNKLAEAGVKTVAVSRNIESSESFNNDNIIVKNCDVTDLQDVKSLVKFIQEKFGQLDIVVNNAGVWQKVSQIEEVDDSVIEELLNTNLRGTIFVTKYALPLLRKSEEAALVNVISKSGTVAQAGQSVYTASKFGAKGFTDVLREDLKETNIHILAVYQAGTNTEMFAKAGDNFPTEKFTKPNDLAEKIVLAIASPNKLWINELHVNYR